MLVRGRRNTGIAALLVALARADPTGETIKSMMRWVCEGLMPELVQYTDIDVVVRLVCMYIVVFMHAAGQGCVLVLSVGVFFWFLWHIQSH